MKDISQLIKQARKSSNLTQLELGLKMNCSKNYISMVESGKSSISIVQACEILRVMDYELIFDVKKIN